MGNPCIGTYANKLGGLPRLNKTKNFGANIDRLGRVHNLSLANSVSVDAEITITVSFSRDDDIREDATVSRVHQTLGTHITNKNKTRSDHRDTST